MAIQPVVTTLQFGPHPVVICSRSLRTLSLPSLLFRPHGPHGLRYSSEIRQISGKTFLAARETPFLDVGVQQRDVHGTDPVCRCHSTATSIHAPEVICPEPPFFLQTLRNKCKHRFLGNGPSVCICTNTNFNRPSSKGLGYTNHSVRVWNFIWVAAHAEWRARGAGDDSGNTARDSEEEDNYIDVSTKRSRRVSDSTSCHVT